MKIQILILSAIVLVTGCNTETKPVNKATADTSAFSTDTTGLAEYKAWKAQNELPVEKEEKPGVEKASSKTATKKTSATASSNSSADNSSSTSTQGEEKKGWSKTAKGAVIGGVVGAGTGAVINKKNRAAGAVIGGIIGAGTGAVVGNEMDKKDGRH
jgi:hypothetical protein